MLGYTFVENWKGFPVVCSKCIISQKTILKNLRNRIFFEKKSTSRQKIGPSGQTVSMVKQFWNPEQHWIPELVYFWKSSQNWVQESLRKTTANSNLKLTLASLKWKWYRTTPKSTIYIIYLLHLATPKNIDICILFYCRNQRWGLWKEVH